MKNRTTYGFKLDFPAEFTMRQLRNLKGRKISYITLYKRVEKGLATGELVVAGKETPNEVRKGARQLVYHRTDALTTSVTSNTPVTV